MLYIHQRLADVSTVIVPLSSGGVFFGNFTLLCYFTSSSGGSRTLIWEAKNKKKVASSFPPRGKVESRRYDLFPPNAKVEVESGSRWPFCICNVYLYLKLIYDYNLIATIRYSSFAVCRLWLLSAVSTKIFIMSDRRTARIRYIDVSLVTAFWSVRNFEYSSDRRTCVVLNIWPNPT